jgi:hypothetical protein
MATGVMEGVSQHPNIKPKFDLTGFNKLIREDENLQDVLECLNLNYGDIMSLSAEKKVILLTFSSAIKCASVNKMLNSLKLQATDQKERDNQSTTSAEPNQPQSLNIEKNNTSSKTNNNNKPEKKINNDATLVAKQHIISFDDNNDNNNN